MTYPIVRRLGVANNEAVVVTLGGTIFTDIGALIVLAVCVGVGSGNFSAGKLLLLLSSLAIYTLLILVGFNRAGRAFLRRSGDEEGSQFVFLLLAIFLAALGAELIGVEKIVGAFLAGLGVNEAVGNSPVREKVVFIGSALFIPIFFVDIGLTLDLPAFVRSIDAIGFATALTGVLVLSKMLAALVTKLLCHYRWREWLTMWGMSIPQLETTLAAALVGARAGLLPEEVLNSVVVMMLVTATLGPLIVNRAAIALPLPSQASPASDSFAPGLSPARDSFTVVVPVSNPDTERDLVDMAALLARQEGGRVVPLSIALVSASLSPAEVSVKIVRHEALLAPAIARCQELGVAVRPVLRLDERIAQGIARASQEQKANLIVMGWGDRASLQARLFGNIIDSVFWNAPCPVAVARLLAPPQTIQRILVPVENFSPAVARKIYFTQVLAAASQAEVTLLQIWPQPLASEQRVWLKEKIRALIAPDAPPVPLEIRLAIRSDPAAKILDCARHFDLVVLQAQRHLTQSLSFAPDDLTERLVAQLTCSAIVLSEPEGSA